MIPVRDDSRTFPPQAIPLVDLTQAEIYAHVVSLKRVNCPLWNDESPTDFGMHILHLFTVLTKLMIDEAQLAKNDTYLPTTQSREAMRALCGLINYALTEALPASVTVRFTCEGGHPGFTILAGTQVSTEDTDAQEAIIYEVGSDTVVGAGVTSIDVVCSQGRTITEEAVGQSTGTSYQRFALFETAVIWNTEKVEVHEGAWDEWTWVEDFVESIATDKHYRTEIGVDGSYVIVFGDGINGAIPLAGTNNIRVTYRVGGGTVGNVVADTITELLSNVTYVDAVTNPAAASGGTDQETLEHARLFAPAAYRSQGRAITTEDIDTLCRMYSSPTYGGVAQARAYAISVHLAQVAIVPATGGLPSEGLRTALSTILNAKAPAGSTIQVIDPHYVDVAITANITVLPSFQLTTVAADVKNRLTAFLAPAYQDPATGVYPHAFGRNVYKSDIYAIIQQTPGVDHCDVLAPTTDTIVETYQIARPGIISITAFGDAHAPAFHDSRHGPSGYRSGDKFGSQAHA